MIDIWSFTFFLIYLVILTVYGMYKERRGYLAGADDTLLYLYSSQSPELQKALGKMESNVMTKVTNKKNNKEK